ncbi:MAG: aspartate-semialdehyde dehydrogenase [Candidatus Caenarcaniphilales bacterium]|nr:aspartate-semialdehyde dehydrogenase [Candidatus Caenarcaniphilales bacterium]
MNLRLGILGGTGKVGTELLRLLESEFAAKLGLLSPPVIFGTARSAGKKIRYAGQELTVMDSSPENLKDLDLIISTANGEVSEKLIPTALRQGCKLVIDTDSFYRMDPKVPLITVGVNDVDIDWHQGIIAGPNCSVAQLIIPLKLLDLAFGLKRVVVSTYQSVSGAGKAAMDLLIDEARKISSIEGLAHKPERAVIDEEQFAFNVIPRISKILPNGYTKEEWKIIDESRKMLNKPDLKITCTAVRVPVLVGHSEAVNLELEKAFTLEEIHSVLKASPELKVWKNFEEYPMPHQVAGTSPVHIGRIRRDESLESGLDLWVVADNLLIGASLNALRIAEVAIKRGKI